MELEKELLEWCISLQTLSNKQTYKLDTYTAIFFSLGRGEPLNIGFYIRSKHLYSFIIYRTWFNRLYLMMLLFFFFNIFYIYISNESTFNVSSSFFGGGVGFGCFQDRVSLCSPCCPGTHSVDQAGIELRNLPASASQSAGITSVHHHHLANVSSS